MKKHHDHLLMPGILGVLLLAGSLCSPAWSEESDETSKKKQKQSTEGLLSEDIAAKADREKYTIQELRIGGRLERITVYHNNNLTEVYENSRPESMWLQEEKELGEMPNLRRWIIGSW